MLDPSILVGTGQPGVANVHVPAAAAPDVQQRIEQAETVSQILAAIVQIGSQVDTADNLEQAATIAARLLQKELSASGVMIAWRTSEGDRTRIIADTTDQTSDRSDETIRFADAAAEEAAARGAITHWPAKDNKNRHALMAVSQFAKTISATSIIAASLNDHSGENRGAILVIDCHRPASQAATRMLDTLRGPLATKLAAIQRWQPGRLEAAIRSASNAAGREKRRWAIAAALSVCLVMVLPLRYRVKGSCELQPVQRRFVAAPFDGPLQLAMVRPGDLVSEGDLLAKINPREIEYKLAGVRADLSRAQQEQKGLMAQHDFAGSKLAELESARLRFETELLEYQQSNLEIRSPIRGVVVAGDLKQSEGTPLSRGETLFEIAPLGEMVVEIAIAEDDFPHVRCGMPVDFYLFALPDRSLQGMLERIHPRSELKDHENVFVGEVRIRDPDNLLRPGMRGRASIIGDRHPLGWNLFHKAYDALRSTVGW